MRKDKIDSIFSEFYETHLSYMKGFLLSRFNFRHGEEIEDYLQEVFIHIYSCMSTFRNESSLKTWASKLALNYCRNKFRSQNAGKRDKRKNVYILDDSIDIDTPSPEKNALDKLIEEEEREIIRSNYPKIAKEYAESVELMLRGFRIVDIARMLKVSYKTVSGRFFKAKLALGALVRRRYKYGRLEGWQSG